MAATGCESYYRGRLMERLVATVPGDAFGELGNGFIRCSYASSTENILKAVERIDAFMQSL